MLWLRLTLALILLSFAARAGADPATNAAPSTNAPPLTNAPASTNAAPITAAFTSIATAITTTSSATTNTAATKPKTKPHVKPALPDDDTLATNAPPPPYTGPFPRPLDSYGDEGSNDVFTVLANRAFAEKFNLVATLIFLLAIIHTFLAPKILAWSHRLQDEHEERLQQRFGATENVPRPRWQSIPAAILHFFGEVEVIFGLWTVPLAVAMVIEKGADVARHYFDQDVSYIEPLFVVVIMAIAASRPIVDFAVRVLGLIAGDSPQRWWIALLTLGPLLGSFITEPAAMTLCALLLGREFYRLGPSAAFKYATLGLLFVNISVGGVLTSFAAPPVLIVAGKWGWTTPYMLEHFGLRALAGILVANAVYFLIFRKQFPALAEYREANPAQGTGGPRARAALGHAGARRLSRLDRPRRARARALHRRLPFLPRLRHVDRGVPGGNQPSPAAARRLFPRRPRRPRRPARLVARAGAGAADGISAAHRRDRAHGVQ